MLCPTMCGRCCDLWGRAQQQGKMLARYNTSSPPTSVRTIARRTSYVTLIIPERLAATCRATPERRAWLERLPNTIRELQDRWALSLGAPFDGNEVSCAWVAPAVRS